ncbi:hypothetical protein N431DRAFT_546073 [Stipitochalara longipes BDJ]|nr:hypothetical protein N431DRAFT_546073 [Stipitochalara longipes BDJ]
MSSAKQHRKGNGRSIKARSFTCFPRLPLELRQLIWKHVSFQRRDVDITASFLSHTLAIDSEADFPEEFHYISVCPPPAILSVNREARSEGLRWYILDFGAPSIKFPSTSTLSFFEREVKPHIYINWNIDRICLVNWGLIGRLFWPHAAMDFKEKCRKNKLRFLACNLHDFYFHRSVRKYLESEGMEEIAFFHSSVWLYKPPRERRIRLEDRRMNQVGAYQWIVDSVLADRKRREEEVAQFMESNFGSSFGPVTPLVVKLVRLMQ